MAILGTPFLEFDRENPEYTINDFKTYMRVFKIFADTEEFKDLYTIFYPMANEKILYSIFGSDWKMAMSLCIAHYITLIGEQQESPAGYDIGDIAARGKSTDGIMTSAGVGGFSKTWDLDRSMSNTKDAIWWNSTKWGQQLYNLYMSKPVLSMIVVTSGPITHNPNPPRRY